VHYLQHCGHAINCNYLVSHPSQHYSHAACTAPDIGDLRANRQPKSLNPLQRNLLPALIDPAE
jgi:hypothetical protein